MAPASVAPAGAKTAEICSPAHSSSVYAVGPEITMFGLAQRRRVHAQISPGHTCGQGHTTAKRTSAQAEGKQGTYPLVLLSTDRNNTPSEVEMKAVVIKVGNECRLVSAASHACQPHLKRCWKVAAASLLRHRA
jgi:hypothetical protein